MFREVQGFRFQVSGFRFKVQGFRFKVQGFRFKVSVNINRRLGFNVDYQNVLWGVRADPADQRYLV